jgi:putative hydrolase of the HAD superfamily
MNILNNINTIIFDFDYTLSNRDIAAYKLYEKLLIESSGFKSDDIRLLAMIQDCLLWDQYGTSNKQSILKQLNKKYGVLVNIDDFSDYWDKHLFIYTVLYNDTIKVLDKLKLNHYKLGVITNGDSYGQRMKLQVSGITDYFDIVLIGGDYANQKPCKDIFDLALQKLKSKKHQTLYVGDSFSNDVVGAYNAGIKPVWIWRHGEKYLNASIIKISCLYDLLEILEVE